MITLTVPAQVNSVLGGSVPVAYNKFVIAPLTMNAVEQTVTATILLTSTASPDMQAITGRLTINCVSKILEISVQQLDFYRRVVLTVAQNDAVIAQIRAAQNGLEAGLVTLGVVVGTQANGA